MTRIVATGSKEKVLLTTQYAKSFSKLLVKNIVQHVHKTWSTAHTKTLQHDGRSIVVF